MNLYNQMGFASAYSSNNMHFFNNNRQQIGYQSDGHFYSPDGTYLGTFQGGWLISATGEAVCYAPQEPQLRGGDAQPSKRKSSKRSW